MMIDFIKFDCESMGYTLYGDPYHGPRHLRFELCCDVWGWVRWMPSDRQSELTRVIGEVYERADVTKTEMSALDKELADLKDKESAIADDDARFTVLRQGLATRRRDIELRKEELWETCDEARLRERLTPFIIEAALLTERRHRGRVTRAQTRLLPAPNLWVEALMPAAEEIRPADAVTLVDMLPKLKVAASTTQDENRLRELHKLIDKLQPALKHASDLASKDELAAEVSRVFQLSDAEDREDLDEVCETCGALLLAVPETSLGFCPACKTTTDKRIDYTCANTDTRRRRDKRQDSSKGEAQFLKQLMCGQYKESTDVASSVIESLRAECEKRCAARKLVSRDGVVIAKVSDMGFDTFYTLVHDLRTDPRFRLKKYYINIHQMWCRITGHAPFRFTAEEENIIRIIHSAVRRVVESDTNPIRKTAIKAQFQIHLMCQYLHIHRALEYFQTLKVPEIRQDRADNFRTMLRKAGFTETVFRDIRSHMHRQPVAKLSDAGKLET